MLTTEHEYAISFSIAALHSLHIVFIGRSSVSFQNFPIYVHYVAKSWYYGFSGYGGQVICLKI